MNKREGFTLFTASLLIAVVTVAVLGLTVFVVQETRRINAEQNKLAAIYLARAGIQNVAYQYRRYGRITLGSISDPQFPGTATVDANQAGLLLVDAKSGRVITTYYFRIYLKNVTNSKSITVRRIRIRWTPNQNEWVRVRISPGGWWSVWRKNGWWIPYNYTLSTTNWRILYVRFSSPTMFNKTTFQFTFRMADGTQTEPVTWYVAPSSTNLHFSKFTVNSTGTVNNVSRRVEATIDVSNNSTTYITTWKEI